ncbi:MAG: choice-of-anchor L domain-containing protein [Enhygromyxa sp.]
MLALCSAACTGSPGSEGNTDGALTLDGNNDDDVPAETGDDGCQSDVDCQGHPDGPVCDKGTGLCHPDCEPGDIGECYEGPPGTLGVGECASGTRTCTAAGTWGACIGQTLPSQEICDNDLDEDCDGSLLGVDLDGDGWSACQGDCCDDEVFGCVDAHLVNPGAFEVPGNGVDDDCDGMVDEIEPSCDAGLASNSSDPLDYAAAMDLCQTTSEDAPLPSRTWGVISAKFSLANGESMPLSLQRSIRGEFGEAIGPSGGESLVVLSTGSAAAPGQTQPNYAPFEPGQDLGTTVLAPADWIVANGGEFPASCAGVNPTMGFQANDSVMLTLRVRVPTNARSFTTRMFFFTAEYPEWVCSQYNDFFVALIDSAAVDNPADKNIAIYDDGEAHWPVGLNILKTAPGLFRACESGNVGCQGDLPQTWYDCPPDGADLLAGTGFDAIDTGNSCNGAGFPVGGGTGWLEMSGNVEPGEIMEIRFAVWDAGGHLFDALVLLDDWRWSLDAASPGVSTP